MGTCNFITQDNFDFYVWDYYPTDEEVKDFIIVNEYIEPDNITQSDIYNYAIDLYQLECNDLIFRFNYYKDRILSKYKHQLKFFDITLKDGYYYGLQFYIEPQDYLQDFFYDFNRYNFYDWLKDISNEDTQYYFNECRSVIIRQLVSEINFINKKILPKLAKELDFTGAKLIGVFSNGEGVYEYV